MLMLMLMLMIIASLTSQLQAAYLPGDHRIAADVEEGARLPSNSIIDIVWYDSSLWLGTGQGLAELHLAIPGGWSVIDEADGIGRGGLSALVVNDTVIWAATAYSENTDFGWKPAGGGVGFSSDSGRTWTWFDQPVDDPNEQDYSPTTTNIQNLTYDIALSQTAVWIASFGGGLRKLPFGEDEWIVVPPDTNDFSAYNFYNHRAFSAVFYNGILYAGTAAGVNRSWDEGEHWTNSKHAAGNPASISGNFVTAMGVQVTDHGHYIWAATWKAEGGTEYYGVSVSEDEGLSWRVALSDSTLLPNGEYLIDHYGSLRAHNFGFNGDKVYVAADNGLWIDDSLGFGWEDGADWPLESIYDPSLGERLENIDFFSVAPVGDSLWVGTDDGLAVGWFDGANYNWRIQRAHQPAGRGGEPSTYAYPNPFSPLREHTTRLQIPVNGQTYVKYDIYNFAMEKVIGGATTLPGGGVNGMEGYGAITWNGKDNRKKIVANGVYFYRIEAGGNTWWGKIMVLD